MTVPDQNLSLGFIKKVAIRDAVVIMYDTAFDCHDEADAVLRNDNIFVALGTSESKAQARQILMTKLQCLESQHVRRKQMKTSKPSITGDSLASLQQQLHMHLQPPVGNLPFLAICDMDTTAFSQTIMLDACDVPMKVLAKDPKESESLMRVRLLHMQHCPRLLRAREELASSIIVTSSNALPKQIGAFAQRSFTAGETVLTPLQNWQQGNCTEMLKAGDYVFNQPVLDSLGRTKIFHWKCNIYQDVFACINSSSWCPQAGYEHV
jgi:hypothetical protein